jgi:hypothetical protein
VESEGWQRKLTEFNLSCWIKGGQKLPTKIEKSKEFACFEVLDVLF